MMFMCLLSNRLGEAQLMTAKPEPTADPQSASPPGREHFHKHDKKAFAVFTFKYRSLGKRLTQSPLLEPFFLAVR